MCTRVEYRCTFDIRRRSLDVVIKHYFVDFCHCQLPRSQFISTAYTRIEKDNIT